MYIAIEGTAENMRDVKLVSRTTRLVDFLSRLDRFFLQHDQYIQLLQLIFDMSPDRQQSISSSYTLFILSEQYLVCHLSVFQQIRDFCYLR